MSTDNQNVPSDTASNSVFNIAEGGGLVIIGTVTERRKSFVKMGEEMRAKITYQVNTGRQVYSVTSFDTANPLPLGETASVYVTIRAWATRTGAAAYGLEHDTGDSRGETF